MVSGDKHALAYKTICSFEPLDIEFVKAKPNEAQMVCRSDQGMSSPELDRVSHIIRYNLYLWGTLADNMMVSLGQARTPCRIKKVRLSKLPVDMNNINAPEQADSARFSVHGNKRVEEIILQGPIVVEGDYLELLGTLTQFRIVVAHHIYQV